MAVIESCPHSEKVAPALHRVTLACAPVVVQATRCLEVHLSHLVILREQRSLEQVQPQSPAAIRCIITVGVPQVRWMELACD
jgi:hypothetical protein